MAQGGGQGPIPISQLLSRVQVDLGSSTQNLREHRSELQAAADDTKKLGAEAGSGLTTGMETASSSVRQLNADLKAQQQALAELKSYQQGAGGAGAIGQLDEAIKQTEANIAALQSKLGAIATESQAANRTAAQSFLQTASSVDELRTHLTSLQAVQERGRAQGLFTPGLQQEINQTTAAIRSVEGAESDFGRTIGMTTERLLLHATAYAVVYAGIREVTDIWREGVGAATGFQASLLKTEALTVGGAADVRMYSQELVTMSQRLPVSAKDLGDALFYIESHGIKGAAAMELLNQSALGTEAGLGKTADIARIAAGAMEAYGEKELTAAHAVDILTAGVREGSLAPETLANSLGKVLAVAAGLGIPFDEVIANIATLTRQSVPAAQATTELSSVMAAITNPSAQAQKALASVHLTTADLTKSLREDGLLATLSLLEVATGGNAEKLEAILPNVRAFRDVLGVTGNQADAYAKTLKDVENSTGSTKTAAEIMSHAVENQQKVLENNWNALIIGLDVLPKVSAATEFLTDRVKKLTEEQELQKESSLIGNKIRDEFNDQTGAATTKILADAKLMNLSFAQLNDILARVKVNPEFLAEMDYLAQRAQIFRDPFGANYTGTVGTPLGNGLAGPPEVPGANQKPPEGPTYDYEAQRRQAQQLAEMGASARQLHTAAENLQKAEYTEGLVDQAKVTTAKDKMLDAAAEVKVGWDKALSPEEAKRRGAELDAVVDQINQNMAGATADQIAALDKLTAKYGEQDEAVKKAAQTATAARQQQADQARRDRETREADPLLGIRESLNKDRGDLIGTAGQVMADLENAIKLRGQQGAREAGVSFGNEARKWGEELEKAGLPGWEQAFNDLIARGEVAVVTGSPEIVAAIHQMLIDGQDAIKDANIGKAVAEATARANSEMLRSQAQADNQLAQAAAQAADARANAVQQEADREYDIFAGHQVDRLTETDKNERELQRIHEEWGRQNTDREEQERRARDNRDEQAARVARDRAQQNARTLADLAVGQARSQSDTTRSRQREDRDAEYEHTQRLKQIAAQGGPDVAKNTAAENENYKQQLDDRTRKRGEDDAEAEIRRAQQVSDAQKRIAEQTADARLRASEQATDLVKTQGEQDADLIKTRARQLQARVDQQHDSEYLRDRRLEHEQAFFTDAETKAAILQRNEVSRIDARYDHEVAKAAAASEQIQLKRQHDIDDAEIRARAKEGKISEDQATQLLGESDTRFTAQSTGIQSGLQQRETEIDANLRDAIAKSRQYGPGYAQQNVPFEETRQYTPPTPGFDKSGFPFGSTQQDSILSGLQANAAAMPLTFLGQQAGAGAAPIPVVLPDAQIRDMAEAANSQPPTEMDGEQVESVQSKIRRSKFLARSLS